MDDATTDNVLTLGEKMVSLSRLLAAEHVRQEVARLGGAGLVPIFGGPDRPVPVGVRRVERRVERRGGAVYRNAFDGRDGSRDVARKEAA